MSAGFSSSPSVVSIARGYRQSFAVTILNTAVADLRMRINVVGASVLRIGTAAGADGQIITLESVSDARGTHTRATVSLPPAFTRKLGEGAINSVEIESLPQQDPLGSFLINGSAGLNDD